MPLVAATISSRATLIASGAAVGAACFLGGRMLSRRLRTNTAKNGSLKALLRSGKKAVCVGKNYHEHITELAQLGPEWKLEEEPEPVLFLKPTTSYAFPGEPLVLPRARVASSATTPAKHGVHHEVELGIIIGSVAKDVPDEARAMECVAGYVLGLDMTERDEQTSAKNKGMPWTVSKGYDSFLPLSEPFELSEPSAWRELRLWLEVNGERRQSCEAGTMIHSVPHLICFISSIMTLEPGDLILTGTPKGVSRVHAGDRITAGVEGRVKIAVDVQSRPSRRLAHPLIIDQQQLADIGRIPWRSGGGRLAGLTFAAKDNLDVAGLATGNGSPDWAAGSRGSGSVPSAHSPVVAAMVDAGAMLVGKAHMDELAFSVSGENAHYGTLDNPCAPGRTVGGSSSGSAVSVASGLADVALGSDTTGSVRVPSAHCGLYGMRPTHGALSGVGVCPLAPSFDTVGWFARELDAFMAVGDVLLPAAADCNFVPLTTTPTVYVVEDAIERYDAPDRRTVEGLRAAISATAAALASARQGSVRKVRLGAQLLESCPTLRRAYGDGVGEGEAVDGISALCALMREMQAGEIWGTLGEWSETIDPKLGRRPELGADVKPRMAWAKQTSTSAGFVEAAAVREAAREEVKAALDKMLGDGSVLAFTPVAAPPPPPGRAADPGYRARTFELQGPAGMGGLPQMVVPVGTCKVTAMPLAVALVAGRGHDRRLLAMGGELRGIMGVRREW